MFDIKDFYPSISKKLLTDALNFANAHIETSENDLYILFHARKSLLFDKSQTWMKKGGDLFDVTMGAFDGAEICELVGIFMQHQISKHYDTTKIGLYRDDGLAAFKNTSGPQAERIKKKLNSIFKKHGLELVIECNKKIVDYLDVTFNLNDSSYKPYHKPGSKIQYINTESNHPPNIINQIPKTIEIRLSEHSSNEGIFYEAAIVYEKALKESGYRVELKYNPEKQERKQQNRKRNIIWFNPPFNKSLDTKIAKTFLSLIDKHFPKDHKFHKIFNRNTVKVSYSCTKNVKTIINNHNRKILKDNENNNNTKLCNCMKKHECPLDGNCLVTNTIYEASLTSDKPGYQNKIYIGQAETSFKTRYSNHKKSFNSERYKNETELSKEVWKLKNESFTPKIKWRTIKRCVPFNRNSIRCNLCTSEKFIIATNDNQNLLNKRSELISKCRHVNKFMLIRHDTKD